LEKYLSNPKSHQKSTAQLKIRARRKWKKLDRVLGQAPESWKLRETEKHAKSKSFSWLFHNRKKRSTVENALHADSSFWTWRYDFLFKLKSYLASEYGFIPTTYILPKDRKLLKDNFGHETFIVKPAASARGIGIKVT